MIITLMTRRNVNGHRKYLIIDTDAKTYATEPRGIVWKDDAATVTATELQRLREKSRHRVFPR